MKRGVGERACKGRDGRDEGGRVRRNTREVEIVFVMLSVLLGLVRRGSRRVNEDPLTPKRFIPRSPAARSPPDPLENCHPRPRLSGPASFTLHHLEFPFPLAALLPRLSRH